MNNKLRQRKQKISIFLASSILTIGLSEIQFLKAKAEIFWKLIDTPKAQPTPTIWETDITDSLLQGQPKRKWEVIPKSEDPNQTPSGVIWEELETEDDAFIPPSQNSSKSEITPPSSLEEAEALFNIIPLQPSDYQPLLRLSPLVSTAETLPIEQWRIAFGTISPVESETGTGIQNHSINLDIGFNNSLLLSLFVSQTDDQLDSPLNGFTTQPGNYWQSYGAAARWQLMNQNNWKLGIIGSLEGWDVGSGGDDSFSNAGDNSSPNIFNDSGSRVFTSNIVGSLSLPVSWQASDHWQFSFNPGVSFLPAMQGAGQGGAGTFYGTNPYVSGGVLFQPFPELSLTASLAKPIGNGTNSFDADLEFSRVEIYSAGINWDLNPRIGLQGLITNGFGTTPATALLAMPSENRLGYSASFVYTPGTADTPQVPLTSRQAKLAKGGLTVNTALVPQDGTTEAWANADTRNNFNYFLGHSISNVFQLNLFTSALYKNVPQTNEYAQNFAKDDIWNWRVGGKAVAFSPLRGAPFWGGGYISVGHAIDTVNERAPGYLFAETIATLEVNKKIAINLNPKLASSGIGNLWGIGLGANIHLAPNLEFIPETNILLNKISQSNGTLGLRWHATESCSVDVYASTAASIVEVGQLISADEFRWGTRILINF